MKFLAASAFAVLASAIPAGPTFDVAQISKAIRVSLPGTDTATIDEKVAIAEKALALILARSSGAVDKTRSVFVDRRARYPNINASCPGYEIKQYFEIPANVRDTECKNEGILPRDGRRMPMELWKCAFSTVGVGKNVIDLLIGGAFSIATKDADGIARLSLTDLRKHGFIEHDRSLTRYDLNQYGDSWNLYLEKFFEVVFFVEERATDGELIMTFDGLVNWRRFVELDDRNPEAQYGFKVRTTAIGESALLWQLLNKEGKYISVADLADFFNEKLPQHRNEIKLLPVLGSMAAIRCGLGKVATKKKVEELLKALKGGRMNESEMELKAWKASYVT